MSLFRLFSFLLLLTIAQLGLAETEIIDLSGYEEGDIPKHLLGEEITIRQEIKDGETVKYVSGQSSNGKINYTLPNVNNDFEITFVLTTDSMSMFSDIRISLSANNESIFTFDIGSSMKLGDNDGIYYMKAEWDSSAKSNTLKIKVQDGTVKTYINSQFFQSIILEEPDYVYNELTISDLGEDDKIYSMVVNNLDGSPTNTVTSDSSNDFEKGKQAGIQQCVDNPSSCGINTSVTNTGTETIATGDCIANYSNNGELHIPCINVPGAFGNIEMYEVWLQQASGTFNFELDLDRVMAK